MHVYVDIDGEREREGEGEGERERSRAVAAVVEVTMADLVEVIGGKDGTTGVVGVDDDNANSVDVDQRAHLGEVELPAMVGLEVVEARLDAVELAGSHVGAEARLRQQHVGSRAGQHRHAHMDRLRSSHR